MEKILGYDSDKIYMIHLTNFFPKEHKILSTYDGNLIFNEDKYGEKIQVFLGDEVKNVSVPAHRHTVHFTLNTVVENTADGAGNWDGRAMAIVEPMAPHKEQFLSYGGDSYTWGSVNLGNDAIIIISREHLDLIPKDEKDKWNFIICDGDISLEVKKFLRDNNLPVRGYEENDPGHANSYLYKCERNLETRDMAINFVKNNTFDGKSAIEFTVDEFAEIISVLQEPKNTTYMHDILSSATLIGICDNPNEFEIFKEKSRNYQPKEIIRKIIASGFYIAEDGKVKLRSEDEIFDISKKFEQIVNNHISERRKSYGSFATDLLKGASELYAKYVEVLCKKRKEDLKDFEIEIINQTRQSLVEKKEEELSDIEKIMLSECLLSSQYSDLSENELEAVKKMRPRGLGVSEDKYFIETQYSKEGIATISIGGNYSEDFEFLKSKFENIKGIKIEKLLEECIVRLDSQQDGETFGEFYSRIQSCIDAFVKITTTDEQMHEVYEFDAKGIVNKKNGKDLITDAVKLTEGAVRTSKINEQVSRIQEQQSQIEKQTEQIEQ